MKLVYCATPARLAYKKKEIMENVVKQGYAPFHPFQAFPREFFEDGLVGREKTMEFCRRSIEICDEFWLYGISDGTLNELNYAICLNKPIRLFLEFDPEWKKFYENLKSKYDNPLERI